MRPILRTTLFFAFFLAFLISAPLVVLYTAGYRFDLTHRRIVHTAVLNISSIPKNGTIFIDGVEIGEHTPAVIETMLPGIHEIRLEKTGFLPWRENMTFQSNEATFAKDIVLFLDTTPQIIETIAAENTSVSPDGSRLAFITQESSWLEVWTTQGSPETKKLLMRVPLKATTDSKLSWSLNGSYLLFSRRNGNTHEISVAKTSDGSALEIPQEIQNVQDVWWDAAQDDLLYLSQANAISAVTLTDGKRRTISMPATRVQSFGNRDIMLSQNQNRSVLSFEESGTASIITYLPLGSYEFVRGPAGFVTLFEEKNNRLFVIDPHAPDQPIVFHEEVALWSWNSSGDELLYSSGYDLKLYRVHEQSMETLTRLSKPLSHIAWYPRGHVGLFQSDGVTSALSLDQRNSPSLFPLIKEASGPFWIGSEGDVLYVLKESRVDKDVIFERSLQ